MMPYQSKYPAENNCLEVRQSNAKIECQLDRNCEKNVDYEFCLWMCQVPVNPLVSESAQVCLCLSHSIPQSQAATS